MRKIPVPMQRESEREKRKEEKNVTKRKKEIKRGEVIPAPGGSQLKILTSCTRLQFLEAHRRLC